MTASWRIWLAGWQILAPCLPFIFCFVYFAEEKHNLAFSAIPYHELLLQVL
jgi:hypothetical protein